MTKTYEKELMKRQSVESLVAAADLAKSEVRQALELLASAKKRLEAGFGGYRTGLFPGGTLSDYDVGDERDEAACIELIHRNGWRAVADQMQIRELLSSKRCEEMDKQLEKGDLPELTVENVISFFTETCERLGDYLDESVREVFEFLRPHHARHKTNTEYEVGKKAILSYVFQSWGYMDHRRADQLRSLDSCFRMLDGAGIAKYPDDLATKIKQAANNNEPEVETDYFRCKLYLKSGTLHVIFKRPDLVKKLNEVAAGKSLKHDVNATRQEGRAA